MNIYELYNKVKREEIDYSYILGEIDNYKQPRLKIKQWLAKKELIRIKKGIYVFNPKITGQSYSKEILANWAQYMPKFVKVMPVDYLRALKEMQAQTTGEMNIGLRTN